MKILNFTLTICAFVFINLFSNQTTYAQNGQFDIRAISDCSEIFQGNYYVDLEIKAHDATTHFKLSDMNIRFTYDNLAAIANPVADASNGLIGPQLDADVDVTWFDTPNLQGSFSNIISYNVQAGGSGYLLNESNWINIGRVRFDVLDLQSAVEVEISINDHDPANFPSTEIYERVANVNHATIEGDYFNINCLQNSCYFLSDENFETPAPDYWTGNGSHGRKVGSAFCQNGGTCMRIRGNSPNASFNTNTMDLRPYDEITLDFLYQYRDMEAGDTWLLELSLDGGASYTNIRTWTFAAPFVNHVMYNESLSISATFTQNTILRFRSTTSNNTDWIFIDNIHLEGCDRNGNASMIGSTSPTIASIKVDKTFNIESLRVYPNPVYQNMTIATDLSNTTNTELVITDFTGKILMTKSLDQVDGFQETQVDVSNWSAGIYYATIISDRQTKTEKFIIAKD